MSTFSYISGRPFGFPDSIYQGKRGALLHLAHPADDSGVMPMQPMPLPPGGPVHHGRFVSLQRSLSAPCWPVRAAVHPTTEIKAIVIGNTLLWLPVKASTALKSRWPATVSSTKLFEGYISNAIYEDDVDPEVMNPKVESLWRGTNVDGDPGCRL